MLQWLAILYLPPAALIFAALMKYFAPRTWKRRGIVAGIAVTWPVLAAIIFLGR